MIVTRQLAHITLRDVVIISRPLPVSLSPPIYLLEILHSVCSVLYTACVDPSLRENPEQIIALIHIWKSGFTLGGGCVSQP